jgi:ATP-dependent helicase/nuclease subunit B
MKRQPLPEAARTLLVRLFGDREFAPNSPRDQLTTALASAWLRIAADLETCCARFRLAPAPDEAFSLSLELLAQERLTEPRGEVDLILQGWLELLWEASPGLIITGLNEEHVPGILISHTFLPDGLRRQLELPCLATRFARDAYLLHAIAEQRVQNGRLELLFGQWSERGDSLRPSRLLFLCPDSELPSRTTHLFPKEHQVAREPEPARTLAWKLNAKFVRPSIASISPSRIRSYLECAFRDYLSNELRMEAVEPRKRELAPNEFGSLAHHAFQCLAGDPSVSLSTDAREIEEFLIESALQRGRKLYGARWAPLVGLQIESLKQRLRNAAQCEAEQRELGWRIVKAEWQLGGRDDEHPLLIEGARLRCTIDRIEQHEKTGEIRVLDFKTADKAGDPKSEHTDKITARKRVLPEDEWKCFDHSSGVRLRWKDLQLPLYAAALRLRGISAQSVGYFAIPKSVQETQLKTWENFNDEWVDAALACAAEVVRRLREGIFWPPAPRARDRSFDTLFLGDINATVDITPAESPVASPSKDGISPASL